MLAIIALDPNWMDLEAEVVTKNPYSTNKALGAKLLVTVFKLLGPLNFRVTPTLNFREGAQSHLEKLLVSEKKWK